MTSRREEFDEIVLEVADRLGPALARARAEVEFAVEDVPPGDPAPWEEQVAPLARLFPGTSRLPHRIVVYRRCVEARATSATDLADLVDEVVVDQVATLLGVSPEELDQP